jgi:hypothetical protein
VLRRHNWNRLAAAKELGIHKTTLWKKIRQFGLTVPTDWCTMCMCATRELQLWLQYCTLLSPPNRTFSLSRTLLLAIRIVPQAASFGIASASGLARRSPRLCPAGGNPSGVQSVGMGSGLR